MLRHLLVVGLCLVPLTWALGQTSDQTANLSHSNDNYRAPQGFGGYTWNTPLGKFKRLAREPVYVRVAHSRGKITYFDFSCWQGLSSGGSDNVLAMKACRKVEGEGYHSLAEYYVDSQGFRIGAQGSMVVMFPVTYQFCAQWTGFSRTLKGDPTEQLQLCGVRLYFRSETATQEQAISDNAYRTSYERTLNWLIDEHGEPEDFEREGVVYFPNWDAEPQRKIASKDRFRNWYWCRPRHDDLVPNCSASIVLTFDAETGLGQVLYLTSPVWVYAYARQFGGAEGDPLYRVLHGGMAQPPVEHQCMDTFLCRPPPPSAMPEEQLAKFRLPTKSVDVKN